MWLERLESGDADDAEWKGIQENSGKARRTKNQQRIP